MADLQEQLVDTGDARLLLGGTTARKCRCHVFYRCPLPSPDLRRMDAVRLGRLSQRHFFADRLKRNLGFKLRRMAFAFLHFGSSLSS